jgi:hypothetical protein
MLKIFARVSVGGSPQFHHKDFHNYGGVGEEMCIQSENLKARDHL